MKTLLLLAALLFSPLVSWAADIELGLGVSHFQHAENGFWYQEEFPYRLRMNSPSFSIGLKHRVSDGWNMRYGYEYMGRVRSDAIAVASDENYAECRYELDKCWRTSSWNGKGDVQGVYVAVQPEIELGSYTLTFEGGVSAYYSRWRVQIPDWIGHVNDTPHAIEAVHRARWHRTFIIGAGVRRGPWSVNYTVRDAVASGDEFPAIYTGLVHNFSLRRSF